MRMWLQIFETFLRRLWSTVANVNDEGVLKLHKTSCSLQDRDEITHVRLVYREKQNVKNVQMVGCIFLITSISGKSFMAHYK